MKKLILRLIVFIGCLIPLPALAQNISGAQVYNDNCARCHSPRAPAEFSDSTWEVIIHHMHTRGYLTERERVSVLRFLQENNRTARARPAALKPAMKKNGSPEALIAQYGCKGCHVIGGSGGTIGPVLDTVFQRRDEKFIMQKLTDPKVDNPRSVMPLFNLSEADKKNIVKFLGSLRK